MVKKLVVVSLVCAVAAAVYGQGAAAPATPAAGAAPGAVQAEKGMKDAFAGKFLIGACAESTGYSEVEKAHIKKHYNAITAENSMKPEGLHPRPDTYNYTRQDALVQWCQENDIKVVGHTLVWHAQTPGWFFQGADGQPATKEVVVANLRDHIKNVAGHYKGKLISWDVVNEAISDRPGGLNGEENLRPSNWSRIVGPEFLTLAFKYAREADPDVKLYYNDYNIEQGAVADTGKHKASMALLKRLIKDGAPIDGVGIQGHWHLDTNLADVEKAIENYASLGLKVSITELDVTATGTNSGAMPGAGGGRRGQATVGPEGFKQQAAVYAKLFDIFNRHADVVERVTFWGISDRRSWRSGQLPLVFDRELQPKPAFEALMAIGAGKPLAEVLK